MGQDACEWRRLRAWEPHQAGWTGTAIVEALPASRAAVCTWLKRARAGGEEALHRSSPPGRVLKLSPRSAQLPARLGKGLEAYGFSGGGWTPKRVAAVIQRACGVHYHPARVSRRVRQEGRSLQKPVVRATQRAEDANEAWRADAWPALQAKRRLRVGPSSS